MRKWLICPKCGGEGVIDSQASQCEWDEWTDSHCSLCNCSLCKGMGRITDDKLADWKVECRRK